VLVRYHLFLNHFVFYNEFTFFDTSRVWEFANIFVFNTIWVYMLCKNLHTWQHRPSITMVWNGVDQIIIQVYNDFYHLDILTKYEYLTGITILIPTGRFFDTIIDVDYWYHAFTYIPNWWIPQFETKLTLKWSIYIVHGVMLNLQIHTDKYLKHI
jgi:hypothetical protein